MGTSAAQVEQPDTAAALTRRADAEETAEYDKLSTDLVAALGLRTAKGDLDDFYQATRSEQRQVLASVGVKMPEGDLRELDQQEYVFGQLLRQSGETIRGAQLMVGSGLTESDLALDLVAELVRADAYAPHEQAIADFQFARNQSRSSAIQRARMQFLAYDVRPILRELDSGYLALAIAEDGSLRYSTSADLAVAKRVFEQAAISNVSLSQSDFSETDLIARVEEASEAAFDVGLSEGDFTIMSSKQDQSVSIHVPKQAENSEAAQRLAARFASSSGPSVEIVASSLDRKLNADAVGGYSNGVGSNGFCTWGFNVRKVSNNVRRWTTAGHCQGQRFFGGILQPWKSQVINYRADMETRNVVGHTPTNDVLTFGQQIRQITSRKHWNNMDIGDTVCQYGMNTEYSCGEIESVTDPNQRGTGSKWVRITGPNYLQGSGDSGGPMAIGSAALGTHESGDLFTNGHFGWFGAMNFAEFELGVATVTS